MNKVLEKERIKYLIVSLDNSGKPVYLHSLHNFKWELTPSIERATKAMNRETAYTILNNYYTDIRPQGEEWLVMPVCIQYHLVNES